MPSPIRPGRSFVLGGARSGKSAFAERLLADAGPVVYAATAPRYEHDAEWSERIARHRADRPARWITEEVGARPERLGELLRTSRKPVLVDCLTLWLTGAMDAVGAWDEQEWRSGAARGRLDALVTALTDGFAQAGARIVAVSNEVGFGIVPESPGTRRFRDELGRLNQSFAALADDVTLVVAGLPLRLKEAGAAREEHGDARVRE
jgi:adenosylcobinamide kinase / adenosylcobinamide-phosphate guanylyltransferase